ncbi:MAG: serine hydrolase domain-containing protein [Bacteroidota bacterium]
MRNKINNNFESLNRFIKQNFDKWNIPGMAIGVLHQGEMTTAGFGVTNINHQLPITDDTLFQIGSITKTYVGTAIMRLVELGKLNLDSTIQTYLPDFKVADETTSAKATIRHLLTHTSCFVGDIFRDTGSGDNALANYVATLVNSEQLAPLGTSFSYNNAGFSILGLIIEKVTGKTFEAALGELVFDPLGLENTYLRPTDVMAHRFVVGHHKGKNGLEIALPWQIERSGYPQGGIISNIKDVLRYADFHISNGTIVDGPRLLSENSFEQMHSPLTFVRDNEYWGLSWNVKQVDGLRQISHGGATNGQICLLTLFPEHQFAIAVLTNAQNGDSIIEEITGYALKNYLGVVIPEPEQIKASEEELAAYTGYYERQYMDVELYMQSGKLMCKMIIKQGFPNEETPPEPSPPPMTIALCKKDCFIVLDGEYKGSKVDIIRRSDGAIGWLRLGARIHPRKED